MGPLSWNRWAGFLPETTYMDSMKKQPSPSQLARSERMRVASIEGAKARADYEANDVAVRKNMERLRALRLAKEAQQAAEPQPVKAKAKAKAKKTLAKPAATLSQWMRSEKDSGRMT